MITKNLFLQDALILDLFFKVLSEILKFVDFRHEISSLLNEDLSDYDHENSQKNFFDISARFFENLKLMKANLKRTENKNFYYLGLKLNEIK